MGIKKGKRMEFPAGAVYAFVAALSLICVTVLAVALGSDWREADVETEYQKPPDVRAPHLEIENVFFMSVESPQVVVSITVYVTNDGLEKANDVEIHAWPVIEETNMAPSKMVLKFGDIGVNSTADSAEDLVLQAGRVHSVELLVFESNMLVLKGRASVSTKGEGGSDYRGYDVKGGSGDADYDGIPDEWEVHYGMDPEDPSDADKDYDGDGFSNLQEYRLSRDPLGGPSGGDESTAIETEEGTGGAAMIGAAFVFLVIIGVISILVFAAVRSRMKMTPPSGDDMFKDIPEIKDDKQTNEYEPEPDERFYMDFLGDEDDREQSSKEGNTQEDVRERED